MTAVKVPRGRACLPRARGVAQNARRNAPNVLRERKTAVQARSLNVGSGEWLSGDARARLHTASKTQKHAQKRARTSRRSWQQKAFSSKRFAKGTPPMNQRVQNCEAVSGCSSRRQPEEQCPCGVWSKKPRSKTDVELKYFKSAFASSPRSCATQGNRGLCAPCPLALAATSC